MSVTRPIGLKAAAPTPHAPDTIQTSTGPVLDTRMMYARLNAIAAAGRGSRS